VAEPLLRQHWGRAFGGTRAISPDILHFPARVLVRQVATSRNTQRLCSRAGFCRPSRATCDSPFSELRPRMLQARGGSVGQSVNTPWLRGHERLTGISRTKPIGWLQHASGARPQRLIAGLRGPHPRCPSTSRQPSVRETPNAEARRCVGLGSRNGSWKTPKRRK
jgi:hypothetical protein